MRDREREREMAMAMEKEGDSQVQWRVERRVACAWCRGDCIGGERPQTRDDEQIGRVGRSVRVENSKNFDPTQPNLPT